MTLPLSKKALRIEAIQRRDAVDPATVDMDRAVSLFFEAINPRQEQVVACYCAKGREFDPSGIIDRLLADNFPCALPVVQPDSRILRFALWKRGDELVSGPYNILQPAVTEQTEWADPDIVLLPLLAFDSQGNRLGYGGGYYDATLRYFRGKRPIQAIGLGYDRQKMEQSLPTEPYDERLDWAITPEKAYGFL